MNSRFSDIVSGLVFTGLLIGTAIFQPEFKKELLVFVVLFGLLTLGSLFFKQSSKSSFLFYILLGALIYLNIYVVTNFILNALNPGDGWAVDSSGERVRVMQMNWIWCIFTGIILSPILILLYHKRIVRNKSLEISLTTVFIVLTAILYIKAEMQ